MDRWQIMTDLQKRVPPGLDGSEARRRINAATCAWEMGANDHHMQAILEGRDHDDVMDEVESTTPNLDALIEERTGVPQGPNKLEVAAKPARRLADRLSSGDPKVSLAAIRDLRKLVDRVEFFAVLDARGAGWSWRDIADLLDVTRQAVHRRYAGLVAEPESRRPRRRALRLPVRG